MNKNLALASSALASLTVAATPRSVHAAPRADASDPKVLFAQLNQAFEEFKTTNETKAAEQDSLVQAKIDKLNDSMSTIEAAIDDANRRLAAAALNPGDLPSTNPEYLAGFKAHMRTGAVSAAMTEGTASQGGYVAPVEWDRTVTNKLKQRSPIRENAQVITISAGGFTRVYNDGVIGSGWVGETAARPETGTPGLTSLTFNTGELYANPAITQVLLEDAALDLEAWLAGEVSGEFAIQENIAFLTGNGTNKPSGVLNYVTGGTMAATHPLGAITATTAAGAAAVTTDELLDLQLSLPAEREGEAKFFMARASVGKVRKLKDSTNQYLWQPGLVAGAPSTLLGNPVVEVPGMPAMTTGNVSMLYGDMAMTYLVIDRVGLEVMRDPFTNKPYVMFYTRKRVGGGVQQPEYMKALKQA
jgi:HK97 family phage major capsid protein